MPEAIFINYVNGDHRNDIEQQRKISAHASEQKQTRRRAACRRKRNPDAATDALEAHDLCMRKPKGRPPSLDIVHSSSIVAQLGLYRQAKSNASIKSIEFDPYSNFSSMDVPEHRRIVDYGTLLHEAVNLHLTDERNSSSSTLRPKHPATSASSGLRARLNQEELRNGIDEPRALLRHHGHGIC
jgi:hypothetical protein